MSLGDFIKSCHTHLLSFAPDSEVRIAQDYLAARKVLEKTIKSVRIGYASSAIVLPDAVRHFGEEYRQDEDGRRWDMSSYIRGKIIIPVYSEFGSLVGLATRKPSFEKGNTWWNLPNPFKKGNHLFLLNIARKSIFDKNKVYVVEGYMDAILLWQYGLTNVVSLMGTALTSRKIGLMTRYCSNVCLCFDTDENEAGQRANDMAIATLKKFDFCESISTIHLPVKEDPDEYIVKHGLDGFLAQERTLSDVEIEKICRKVTKQKHTKEIIYAQ